MRLLVSLAHGAVVGYTTGLAYGGLNLTSIAVILLIVLGPLLIDHLALLESTLNE